MPLEPPPPPLLQRSLDAIPLSANWALFLDFDGTLAEIAETPDTVRVEPDLVTTLQRLINWLDGAVALISGRPIADLDRIVTPLRPMAAGLHGLERRFGDHVECAPENEGALELLRRRLKHFAAAHPGVLIEDKGAAIALHFRRVPELADACRREMEEAAQELPEIRLLAGKMVIEAKSDGRHKGDAIRAFMAEPPFAGRIPVFAGDDTTDEDGFAVVNELGGITIKIGVGETQGHYRADNVAEFLKWLHGLPNALAEKAR